MRQTANPRPADIVAGNREGIGAIFELMERENNTIRWLKLNEPWEWRTLNEQRRVSMCQRLALHRDSMGATVPITECDV